jgi:hypothetical protein
MEVKTKWPAGSGRQSATIAAVTLLFSLMTACATTRQVHSTPEHQTINLKAGDLETHGLAFLTPSTVTTQEEDKQALAFVFADALHRSRPGIEFKTLAETIAAINRAELAEDYRDMYHDYRDTGVFDRDVMARIAAAVGSRYLAQIKLGALKQDARGRFGVLGLSVFNTQYANVRVFFQIWDSTDGSIVWEGINEVSYAEDTGAERVITFRAVVGAAAEELIKRMP